MFWFWIMCIMVVVSLKILNSIRTITALFSLLSIYVGFSTVCVLEGLDYMGLLLLVIYVGAVGILFLFILMLVDSEGKSNWGVLESKREWYLLIVLWLFRVGLMFIEGDVLDIGCYSNWCNILDRGGNMEWVGLFLYSRFLYEVLVVGLLCVVVIVSVVYLSESKVG